MKAQNENPRGGTTDQLGKTTAGSLLTQDHQTHPPTTQEEQGPPQGAEAPRAHPSTQEGGGAQAPTGRQIRLMTNSRKPQSEKLATGGGRGTTAVKPDNN